MESFHELGEKGSDGADTQEGRAMLGTDYFPVGLFLNVGLSDATAPALDPRVRVFKLHSTEPSGFPQALPVAVD